MYYNRILTILLTFLTSLNVIIVIEGETRFYRFYCFSEQLCLKVCIFPQQHVIMNSAVFFD